MSRSYQNRHRLAFSFPGALQVERHGFERHGGARSRGWSPGVNQKHPILIKFLLLLVVRHLFLIASLLLLVRHLLLLARHLLLVASTQTSSNRCHASSNRCLTSSNKDAIRNKSIATSKFSFFSPSMTLLLTLGQTMWVFVKKTMTIGYNHLIYVDS